LANYLLCTVLLPPHCLAASCPTDSLPHFCPSQCPTAPLSRCSIVPLSHCLLALLSRCPHSPSPNFPPASLSPC
jgi:hypothetical protein